MKEVPDTILLQTQLREAKSPDTMNNYDGTQHIPYELSELKKYEYSLLENALVKLARIALKDIQRPQILDAGCGRGELMKIFKGEFDAEVYGLDIDPVCAQMGQAYGEVLVGDIEKLSEAQLERFKRKFDLVICSHVLEHLVCPYRAMQIIKQFSKNYLIIAVPNPHYLLNTLNLVFLRGVRKIMEGHLYSWDAPHFRHFLEEKMGLKIEKWAADRVSLIPWKKVRYLLYRLKILGWLDGRILPAIFPFLSESLIVLCRRID